MKKWLKASWIVIKAFLPLARPKVQQVIKAGEAAEQAIKEDAANSSKS